MTALLQHLEKERDVHKLLVPYTMAGIPDRASFPAALAAVAEHADVVEIGIPYSDPLMDGPVIAAAAERALRAGVGPLEALEETAAIETDAPRVAMTYYNPIHRIGEEEFCRRVIKANIEGLIVPDLPLEESGTLRACARDAGLAWIPLVAPTSSADRIASIAETSTGFVYAVSTLGITGVRTSLSERARPLVEACRKATDLPVLVGIGVSTAEHALEAAAVADGVVIGSAVVARVIEEGPEAAASFLGDIRTALDTV